MHYYLYLSEKSCTFAHLNFPKTYNELQLVTYESIEQSVVSHVKAYCREP